MKSLVSYGEHFLKKLIVIHNYRLAIEEVSNIIDKRHYMSFQYINAIKNKNKMAKERFNEIKNGYYQSVSEWNTHWNINRVKLYRYFGKKHEQNFYDFKADNSDDYKNFSITGKFRYIHFQIRKAQNNEAQNRKAKALDSAEKVYHLLSNDLYDFYDQLIHDIEKQDSETINP